MKSTIILAAVICLPLAACGSWTVPENQPAPGTGDAVRHNIAAQIANPKAPSNAPQTMNGERAGLAMERYTSGKTIPPEPMDESSKQGSNSGGNQSH